VILDSQQHEAGVGADIVTDFEHELGVLAVRQAGEFRDLIGGPVCALWWEQSDRILAAPPAQLR
jgi:hypothetical protein